jgi:hypothetical protein
MTNDNNGTADIQVDECRASPRIPKEDLFFHSQLMDYQNDSTV